MMVLRATFSRRARIGLLVLLLAALLLLLPMRMVFSMLDLDRYGLAARSIHGSIWWARIEQLTIGDVPVGTVRASLSPVQLFVGRARLDIWRRDGLPDDLAGAISVGPGRIGIDDVTGTLPLGAAMAPLPISSVEMIDVSARFLGGSCGHAEGQVRARIAGGIDGLNLSQGLSGTPRCDGDAILLPLVSQSGLEKLNLRISASGRYAVEMLVGTTDPLLAQKLAVAGFTAAGDSFVLRVEGSL